MVGLMLGIYVIIAGVSTLIFGYLTDYVERKRLLLFAGFLWSISNILHVFAQFYWQILVLRTMAAVATGVTTPVLFSYLSDIVSSDSRSKPFAYWGIIYMIGSSAAGILALGFNQIPTNLLDVSSGTISDSISYISEHYSNLLHTWRYPFLILGMMALIATLLAVFLTKEPNRAGSEDIFKDLPPEELRYSYKIKISDLKYIFKKKSNFFLIMNFFDVIGSGVLFAFIFPLITLEMGVNPIDLEGILFFSVLGIFAFLIGWILGPFIFAHWADKKVQSGETFARIRIAIICTVVKIPLIFFAFLMSPNIATQTFFVMGYPFGSIQVNPIVFWILWVVFSVLLGLGFAFSSGIGPNWNGALMDVNLSEHRGTMIAMAALVDQVGRALGAIIGGRAILMYDSIYESVFWVSLWAGLISLCFWIPLLFTYKKDLAEVNQIMAERAEKMKKSLVDRDKNTSETLSI